MPNGEVKVASNRTRTWARINQDVTVAFGTDIDAAIRVVEELGRQMAADPLWRRRILEPPRVERVERIEERGITLKILGHGPGLGAVGGRRASSGSSSSRRSRRTASSCPRPRQVVVTHADAADPVRAAAAPTQEDLADE